MMRIRTRTIGATLALGVGVGLFGCGNAAEELAERAIEEGTGGDVEISEDGVTIIDEDGNELRVGEAAEVPDTWPSDVPVPTGTVVSATTAGGASTLLVTVDEEPQPTFTSIDGELTGNGWNQLSTSDLGGEYGAAYEQDGRSVFVTVLSDGSGGSSVSIAVDSAG